MNTKECTNCRIAISEDGIEVDASKGDLLLEASVLGGILFVVALLYVGKKLVDRKFDK